MEYQPFPEKQRFAVTYQNDGVEFPREWPSERCLLDSYRTDGSIAHSYTIEEFNTEAALHAKAAGRKPYIYTEMTGAQLNELRAKTEIKAHLDRTHERHRQERVEALKAHAAEMADIQASRIRALLDGSHAAAIVAATTDDEVAILHAATIEVARAL